MTALTFVAAEPAPTGAKTYDKPVPVKLKSGKTATYFFQPGKVPPDKLLAVLRDSKTEGGKPLYLFLTPAGNTWQVGEGSNWAPVDAKGLDQKTLEALQQEIIQSVPDVVKSPEMRKTGQEKVEKQGQKPYPKGQQKGFNVLKDPRLETKEKGGMLDTAMAPQEKLFTTIKSWPQETITVDTAKLDNVAKSLLEQQPKGDGKFFGWNYVGQEKAAKGQAKAVNEEGFSRLPGNTTLTITRKPGWKAVQDKIQSSRNQ
jgi:hypothetical protein